MSQLPVRLRAGKLFRPAKRGAIDAANGDWPAVLALFQTDRNEFPLEWPVAAQATPAKSPCQNPKRRSQNRQLTPRNASLTGGIPGNRLRAKISKRFLRDRG